jgi:predicted transcriptional regulator
MIEIVTGTIEEQIIKQLQKTYPITIADLGKHLKLSKATIVRVLQQLQVQGIVQLEPLANKTYIRLIRSDFSFVGKKRQKKFIKHKTGKKPQRSDEYEGIMYS